jgi:hypothetical protein
MVPIADLCVGDRVKIVDAWPVSGPAYGRETYDGGMDHWLGQVVTIRSVSINPDTDDPYSVETRAKIEEDRNEYVGDGWFWFPEMIECIVEDEPEFLPSDQSLDSLFS